MANPKYGSEKKGAPTNYFLTVAPERIQVNLRAQPRGRGALLRSKAFTHCNPLEGLNKGGSLVWESSDPPRSLGSASLPSTGSLSRTTTSACSSCQALILRAKHTKRADLQLRMQGNTFLGAFFKVSSFLKDHNGEEEYSGDRAQPVREKFGRFGDAVVESNMKVMVGGFERVQEIKIGDIEDADTSSMRNPCCLPRLRRDRGSRYGWLQRQRLPILRHA